MDGIIRNFSDEEIARLKGHFEARGPFNNVIIDNFFLPHIAEEIANAFPKYNSDIWTVHYNNEIEVKKACSHWDKFPRPIYSALFELCSVNFCNLLEDIVGKQVYADYGLHGGGLHAHAKAGKLNIHQDYSIHPKLNLQRNYNIIIYMTPNWQSEWGGGLELWSHDYRTGKPYSCVHTIPNKFNRAILFNTAQDSWHGLPEKLDCPEGTQRQSLAVYYLSDIDQYTKPNKRAVFVPYKEQIDNPEVIKFCEERSK